LINFFNSLQSKDQVVLIGVMATALFSFLNFILSIRRIKVDNVTKYRVDWIDKLRNELAEFLQLTNYENVINSTFQFEKFSQYKAKLYKKKNILLFYLNFKGNIDFKIEESINIIVDKTIIILNLMRLRVIVNKMEIERVRVKGVAREIGFEDHVNSVGDEEYIKFLLKYAKENNENTLLKDIDKIDKSEYKSKLIEEYCSTINAKQYINNFFKDIEKISCLKNEEINIEINNLIKNSRIYLKSEWNRIKRESNIVNRKYNEDREVEKLAYQYKNYF